MLFGGFRGFPKIHQSFPFFSGLFQFKIEINQTFPGFSVKVIKVIQNGYLLLVIGKVK